jgi:hypothetical protein
MDHHIIDAFHSRSLIKKDKNGRIKVKIVTYDTLSYNVIIHQTILPSFPLNEKDFKNALKKSTWNKVTIKFKDYNQAYNYCVDILVSELKKGYIRPSWIHGHIKPLDLSNAKF